MKYLALEIQNNEGAVSNLVAAFDNKNQAASKYYTVLSAAAISGLTVHTAMFLDEEGTVYGVQTFKNLSEVENV